MDLSVFKNWFFDFDGTLCDTDADIRAAWRATVADIGLATVRPFDEAFRNGPPIDEITRLMYGDAATPELIDRVRAVFRRHYDESGFPNTRPYPGVPEWLAGLKRASRRVFVVTNKRFRATNLLLDRLGWRPLVDGAYSSDMFMDSPIGKLRKPDLLAEALRREGADPAESVMVGDSGDDVRAGKANRVATVAVGWGYGAAADLVAADLVIGAPPADFASAPPPAIRRFFDRAAAVLEIDPAAATADTRFRDVDGWCSLKAFGMLMMLENDFGVRLDITAFLGKQTLGDLAALIGGGAA